MNLNAFIIGDWPISPILFKDKKVESMVILVVLAESQIGLLMLGSYDRSKYLGDEDTTFIEYIRDVLEKKLSE